ncbi:uncharacterized protein METZ01_LOCUS416761 [marine metagenome]|uniref:Uncharacterized protein n=1 Tax=marine metagenome TaxID=408172 RepID=A0A382WYB7_9ZZZZ
MDILNSAVPSYVKVALERISIDYISVKYYFVLGLERLR